MATKLFLRNTTDNGITDAAIASIIYDMVIGAGSSSDTTVTNTTASGTEIQATKTAGGSTVAWISGRVPAGGFTLTSTDISVWQLESNMNANIGGRFRVYRYSGGTLTELGGGPFNDGIEMNTANREDTWIGNVTDTAFAENDRIVVKYFLTNVGTMGGGFTGTMTFNAADAATGDSFFNIAETVTFKPEEKTGTISSNLPIPTSAMSGQKVDTGTIASNLPVVTSAMTGQKVDTGTFDANLLIPTSNMSGSVSSGPVEHTGTIDTNLLIPTAAFVGQKVDTGTLNSNLLIPTANLSGIAEHIGTLISTLPKPTSVMSGSLGHSGIVGSNLPMIAANLVGSLGHSGIIASNLLIPLSAMIGFIGVPPAGGGDAAVNIGGGITIGGSNISLGDVL